MGSNMAFHERSHCLWATIFYFVSMFSSGIHVFGILLALVHHCLSTKGNKPSRQEQFESSSWNFGHSKCQVRTTQPKGATNVSANPEDLITHKVFVRLLRTIERGTRLILVRFAGIERKVAARFWSPVSSFVQQDRWDVYIEIYQGWCDHRTVQRSPL